jgi:hypothetical protein
MGAMLTYLLRAGAASILIASNPKLPAARWSSRGNGNLVARPEPDGKQRGRAGARKLDLMRCF